MSESWRDDQIRQAELDRERRQQEQAAEQARQGDLDRQRRQAENANDANRAVWMYWNDPMSGFFARIRREDLHNDLLAQEHARQSADLLRRQQEAGADAHRNSPPVAPPPQDGSASSAGLEQEAGNVRRAQRDLVIGGGEPDALRPAASDDRQTRRALVEDAAAETRSTVTDERNRLRDEARSQEGARLDGRELLTEDQRRSALERPPAVETGRDSRRDTFELDRRQEGAVSRPTEGGRGGRDQENIAEANRALWMYWNDPMSGFFARIRREDEHSRVVSEQEAQLAAEFLRRQRELTGHVREDGGGRSGPRPDRPEAVAAQDEPVVSAPAETAAPPSKPSGLAQLGRALWEIVESATGDPGPEAASGSGRDDLIHVMDLDQAQRQEEAAADANLGLWMYWNDPVSGFFARLRREDERNQLVSEHEARLVAEFIRRQQELAGEPGGAGGAGGGGGRGDGDGAGGGDGGHPRPEDGRLPRLVEEALTSRDAAERLVDEVRHRLDREVGEDRVAAVVAAFGGEWSVLAKALAVADDDHDPANRAHLLGKEMQDWRSEVLLADIRSHFRDHAGAPESGAVIATGTQGFGHDLDLNFLGENAATNRRTAIDCLEARFGPPMERIEKLLDLQLFVDSRRLHQWTELPLNEATKRETERTVVAHSEATLAAKLQCHSGTAAEQAWGHRLATLFELPADVVAERQAQIDALANEAAVVTLEERSDELARAFEEVRATDTVRAAAVAAELASTESLRNTTEVGAYLTSGSALKQVLVRDKDLRRGFSPGELMTPSMRYSDVLGEAERLFTTLAKFDQATSEGTAREQIEALKSMAKYAHRLLVTAGQLGAVDFADDRDRRWATGPDRRGVRDLYDLSAALQEGSSEHAAEVLQHSRPLVEGYRQRTEEIVFAIIEEARRRAARQG